MCAMRNPDFKGYLKVILGCMFSGKTSELMKEYRKWTSCDFSCVLINHISDDRYTTSTTQTSTHDGVVAESINVGDNLMEYFKENSDILEYDVVLINEGQFFIDLYNFVDYLVNKHGKRVYVCGLDGDFQRKKFGSILDIIPLCDEVYKIQAICKNCKEKHGIFTHRLTCETEQKVIGSNNYIPVCRFCYNNLNK